MHANITYNMYTQTPDITTCTKIVAWIDNIVPWQGTEAQALDELRKNADELFVLAIEEKARAHCKMLGREEAAKIEVNQKRMREAFDSGPTFSPFSPKYTSA